MDPASFFLILILLVIVPAALLGTWLLGMWGRHASQEGEFDPEREAARPVHREVSSPTIEHTREP